MPTADELRCALAQARRLSRPAGFGLRPAVCTYLDHLAEHDRDELALIAAVRRRILAGEPFSTEEAAAAARFAAAVEGDRPKPLTALTRSGENVTGHSTRRV